MNIPETSYTVRVQYKVMQKEKSKYGTHVLCMKVGECLKAENVKKCIKCIKADKNYRTVEFFHLPSE